MEKLNSCIKNNSFIIIIKKINHFNKANTHTNTYTNPSLLVSTTPLNNPNESKSLDGSFNMPI